MAVIDFGNFACPVHKIISVSRITWSFGVFTKKFEHALIVSLYDGGSRREERFARSFVYNTKEERDKYYYAVVKAMGEDL